MPASPPGSSFVIRGGLFALAEDLLTAVQDSFEDGDGPVASVYVGRANPGELFASAIERICRSAKIPNGKVRLTTVQKLRDAGFEVVLDRSDGQPSCHHNVVFTAPPDMNQAKLFVGCFDTPIANPAKD